MIHKLRALIRNYGDPSRGAHNGDSTSVRDRAGSMVKQKMQSPKAPSKKKAPKF